MDVAYLSYDSKDMKKGGIFICKGAHFLPKYLDEAIDKGAICYISEIEYDIKNLEFPHIIVSDIRRAMAVLANFYYDEPWKDLKLIGITGTKGKSTTTYYMKYILDHYLNSRGKSESAIISSIEVYDGVIK